MKALLKIQEGQVFIKPEDSEWEECVQYYFDCDAVEMEPIPVEIKVVVDGPDMFGEIDATWLEVIPLGEKDEIF